MTMRFTEGQYSGKDQIYQGEGVGLDFGCATTAMGPLRWFFRRHPHLYSKAAGLDDDTLTSIVRLLG